MELRERKTYFRCRHCGKDISFLNTIEGYCGECLYLSGLNINTIKEYNEYLKKTH